MTNRERAEKAAKEVLRSLVVDYSWNAPSACSAGNPEWDAVADIIERAWGQDTEVDDGLCNESTGISFIAGASTFACALPKGHNGEHKRGGNCFAHGRYVGKQCPEWPKCISDLSGGKAQR